MARKRSKLFATGKRVVGSKELIPREHESTAIASLNYDIEHAQMTIEFQERGTYTYFDVEPDTFQEFNAAGMRGTYFNLYIRGKYEYERIL